MMHQQWQLLHYANPAWEWQYVKYFLLATFLGRYLQSVSRISEAAFDLFFKCSARRLNLSLHHYLSVKNISIPSHWIYLPGASSPRRTHPHFLYPSLYSAAQVINSAWQHISSFLSVGNDISRLTLQKWLYLTSLHTLTTLTLAFLAGNVSQSAGSWLWLPVSRRRFPRKGW